MARFIGFRRVGAVLIAGVVLAVGSASPAFAQGRGGGGGGPFGGMFGGGGMNTMFEPTISSRDLDSFVKLFALDAAQKDAAKSLFEAYQQQFMAAAKPMREKWDAARQEARDSGDPGAFREVMEKAGEFRKTRDQMETSFLNDFKVVLSEQQTQKWPKFERMRRRETTIGRGLMSGERVDLFKLVDDLKLPADNREALNETLDQYDVDLDRVLVERNKLFEESQEKIRELFTSGDMEGADKMIKEGREASVKVRDVNRRYAAQLETAIPENKRPEFKEAFKKESFPTVYNETHTMRVVEAAAKLKDLDETQTAGIASIKETYYRELKTLQHDLEVAQEEQEMNFSASGMMARFGGGGGGRGGNNGNNNAGGNNNNNNRGNNANNNNNRGGGGQGARAGGGQGGPGGDDKAGELRRKRREMDSETEKKVTALLNDKQKEKLPQRDNNNNNNNNNRGGGNDNQPARQRGGDNAGGGNNQRRNPGRE